MAPGTQNTRRHGGRDGGAGYGGRRHPGVQGNRGWAIVGHFFGRLHIVPVDVLGEENSAPQYVRALLVQKNGVGFMDLVEGDEIEPDSEDHSSVFQRHPNIAPRFSVPFAVKNEVKVPVTRHRQSLPVADDEVRFFRSWQTLISQVGAIAEGVPRRAAVSVTVVAPRRFDAKTADMMWGKKRDSEVGSCRT